MIAFPAAFTKDRGRKPTKLNYRFFWKKYMYTIGKIPAEFTINKAINHGS
jgi:hypothetical protein